MELPIVHLEAGSRAESPGSPGGWILDGSCYRSMDGVLLVAGAQVRTGVPGSAPASSLGEYLINQQLYKQEWR